MTKPGPRRVPADRVSLSSLAVRGDVAIAWGCSPVCVRRTYFEGRERRRLTLLIDGCWPASVFRKGHSPFRYPVYHLPHCTAHGVPVTDHLDDLTWFGSQATHP